MYRWEFYLRFDVALFTCIACRAPISLPVINVSLCAVGRGALPCFGGLWYTPPTLFLVFCVCIGGSFTCDLMWCFCTCIVCRAPIIFHVIYHHWRELLQVSFLSRQKHVCHNNTFVATNIFFSRQKFCYDKHNFVATNVFCHEKGFVEASILLSQQKTCLSRQK